MVQACKKRKASYVKRKEETQDLKTQVGALQKQVDDLREKAGLAPISSSDQELELWKARSFTNLLERATHEQQIDVARAQSKMLQLQENLSKNPLYRPIRLPKGWAERRNILLSLREEMMTRGCQYVAARSQPLDSGCSHFSDHLYEDENGNFCCERFEFIHFQGVKSLRQVFEAVQFFMNTMEISISEKLGHTTVREDYDNNVDGGPSSCNCRLVSKSSENVTMEMNCIAFAEYFDMRSEFEGQPCAVMVTDCVDADELYPYSPNDRVRRDVGAAIVLTEVIPEKAARSSNDKQSEGGGVQGRRGEEEGVVVLMQRAAFLTIHRPEFEISEASMDSLPEGVSNWGDVMVQAIRGFVQSA
ncbi:hypothetical protein PHYPSEUDO_011530 [Phytophthora pseudosyringae]|uniref:Uncharacterized protein n=1 Tax=Phytophthora pseudosyringae TaxID=221518 RepID=A0A8T1VBL0_9STRA|nr:hypothetical protein PHYPSEUDO_011530 [Phytophthora pseudosyringae]